MKKIFLYLFSIIFLFSTQLNAIEKKKLTDTEWNEKVNTLKWYNEDGKNRKSVLTASRINGKTVYTNGLNI